MKVVLLLASLFALCTLLPLTTATDGVGLVHYYSDSTCTTPDPSSGGQTYYWKDSGTGCSQIGPNRWGNGVCIVGGDTLYVTVYGDSSCATGSSAYVFHGAGTCQSAAFPSYNLIWTCAASDIAIPFFLLALISVVATLML